MKKIVFSMFVLVLTGCVLDDDNEKPIYGKDGGFPVNCRAYVQVAIDGYRNKQYTAEQSMVGLERNCGIYGQAWKNNR